MAVLLNIFQRGAAGFLAILLGLFLTVQLVIGAENDTVIFPGMVQATAQIYGTEAEIFPDMAHDVMLEAVWEKVAKRILEWLGIQGI